MEGEGGERERERRETLAHRGKIAKNELDFAYVVGGQRLSARRSLILLLGRTYSSMRTHI
jgi:hypothetical protein